ncbi:hypothetical protein ACROYT_G007727, partial [Oculina patagonica]
DGVRPKERKQRTKWIRKRGREERKTTTPDDQKHGERLDNTSRTNTHDHEETKKSGGRTRKNRRGARTPKKQHDPEHDTRENRHHDTQSRHGPSRHPGAGGDRKRRPAAETHPDDKRE